MALAYLTINLDAFTGDDHPPISQYSTITLDPGADHIDEDADVIHVRTIVVSLDQQGKAATANGVPCVDGRVPVVAGVAYAVSAPNILRGGPHYIPALTAGQVVDLSDYITPGAPLTPDQATTLTARIVALEETPPGVTDHGALTGLNDDDHPNYLTEARGDARYVPQEFGRLLHSSAQPSDADAGAVINAELDALAAAGGGRLVLRGGRLTVTTSVAIPAGCELVGLGPRVTELYTASDMPAVAFRGGGAQGVRALKVQNAVTGARTTYDIDVTNPTKVVVEDVEVANTLTSTGLGGIRFFGTTLLAGENAFMPQLSRVWIRGGRLRIEKVTDGHFTDGYVWATNRTDGGAVEMANIADGWTFTSVDVVPPLGDGAGYDLANTNNVEMVGGYIDGSYTDVLTGHGLRALNSGRIFVSAYRFYNCGRSAIHLTNTHGCAFTGVGFFNNNKLDAAYPDIDLYSATGNNFTDNVHTCYAARTNGGLLYRADGASTYNNVDGNALDISLGNTYASPYANGVLSTFGSRNRPGVYWPRPLGTPNAIVPAVSTLPFPASAATWPAANAAIFHRFTVERGGYYRYARFRCSAAAGNLQAVVVSLDSAGTTYTRIMDSGVIACATGDLSVDMTQTYLNPGEYAIGLWCDNTSATFWHSLSAAIPSMRMAAKITSGLVGGIPATGAITWSGDRYVFGLTLALA
jgi:hypothetical protein